MTFSCRPGARAAGAASREHRVVVHAERLPPDLNAELRGAMGAAGAHPGDKLGGGGGGGGFKSSSSSTSSSTSSAAASSTKKDETDDGPSCSSCMSRSTAASASGDARPQHRHGRAARGHAVRAHYPSVRKLSKIATLLLARNYILMLTNSLEEMKRLVSEIYGGHHAGFHPSACSGWRTRRPCPPPRLIRRPRRTWRTTTAVHHPILPPAAAAPPPPRPTAAAVSSASLPGSGLSSVGSDGPLTACSSLRRRRLRRRQPRSGRGRPAAGHWRLPALGAACPAPAACTRCPRRTTTCRPWARAACRASPQTPSERAWGQARSGEPGGGSPGLRGGRSQDPPALRPGNSVPRRSAVP